MTVGDPSPFFDRLLKKLKFEGKRHTFSSPAVYEPDYNPDAIKNQYHSSKSYSDFKKIRDNNEFLIFHNSRQIWKTKKSAVSIKDNDVFFRAFKRAKELTQKKIAVIAFEYGWDYKASQDLCRELKIDSDVHWFPLTARKELMIGMSLSDLVAGEFRNSWFTYGVVFESMAVAVPILHNRIDSLYPNEILYPMLPAKNEEEIFQQICFAVNNRQSLKEMGKAANQWYKTQVVEKTISEISNLIRQKEESEKH